jgi:hypothetical protein
MLLAQLLDPVDHLRLDDRAQSVLISHVINSIADNRELTKQLRQQAKELVAKLAR